MKTIPITCHKCSKVFERPKREIDRQIRKGRQYFFCSLSCTQSYNKKTTSILSSKCLFCGKEFETTTHKRARKCCSKECAVKYSQSKVNLETHKESMKRDSIFPQKKHFNCVICDSGFTKQIRFKTQKFHTCSDICYRKLLQINSRKNPNCGGSTNYKKYKYNNVWMDSKWEVELATWMDIEKIKWERSKKLHQFKWTDKDGNKRRYYPDFYLPSLNVYLDPKNKYLVKMDDDKLNRVIQENGITLLWGDIENVKKEIDILRNV